MRMIAEFRKENAARFISHLDLMRVMQRSLRRAGLPVAFSQGFSPHAVLSFATAAPVGCSSLCEVMDLRLERDVSPEDFTACLNAALPAGLRVNRALSCDEGAPAPMAAVLAARYVVQAPGDCTAAAQAFMGAEQVFAMKKGKKGLREIDIRPMVYELSYQCFEDRTIFGCVLRHDNAQALKPALLMEAMGITGAEIQRTALLVKGADGGWASLYALYEGWCP